MQCGWKLSKSGDGQCDCCSEGDYKLTLHSTTHSHLRVDLIRYILIHAKQEFNDVHYSSEEWPEIKPKMPTGKVPVLEITKNGQTRMMTQSLAIARHLATDSGLIGSNCVEAATCDEVVDSLTDLTNLYVLFWLEPDSDRKDKLQRCLANEEAPRLLGYLEKKLAANGGAHIVGKNWTWADFAVSVFFGAMRKSGSAMANVEEQFQGLANLAKSVEALPDIAEFLAKRKQE